MTPVSRNSWFPGRTRAEIRFGPPYFYYLDYDTLSTNYRVRGCPVSGCPDAGPATVVSPDETDRATQTLAADTTAVYWLKDNHVVTCPAGGCADGAAAQVHTTLPAGQTASLVAADGTYVYVMTLEGSLWRVLK